ncbi:MAG: hypothetical protein EOP04_08415 [Proteobacteria bacterium]|nr:MAG: hypothetical protein EOP04_08415 [Pseudomonadota bacterium]
MPSMMRLRLSPLLLMLSLSTLLTSCFFRIPAEDISQLQAGKTFDRQGGYLIGPNDELDIAVFGEESLTGRYTISPAGMLNFRLVSPINVNGMTPAQVTKRLEMALAGIVKRPRVTVALMASRSFNVYFSGQVTRVGTVSLTSETTFLQALTLAGGLTPFATGRIVLIRQIGDAKKVRRFSLRYEDILSGEKFLDSVTLESGDVLYVE